MESLEKLTTHRGGRRTRARLALSKQVEIPLRVREAAAFLGVSPQTVYLWVERSRFPISA
jgi:transposase